ncbi:MAG: hypothetical protein ACR2QC_08575, partial [Gammaproteobacteria bacterium]
LYYFERACRNQHLAMSSGAPLFTVPPEIAAQTAQQWDEYPNQDAHFNELRAILDREEPEYRN